MKVEEIIAKAKKLPPSPEILPKLLAVLEDGEATNWQIAKYIGMDQSLTSQILTWSNSGYYGYTEPSYDLEEAIQRVGINEVYKLVGIALGKRLLDHESKFYALDSGELWENALAAAFTMEALSFRQNLSGNMCYTAGLLHGVGKLVIDQVCQASYKDVFDCINKDNCSLIVAEDKILGFNHAQIGAGLLKKWKFQDKVNASVEFQFDPFKTIDHRKMACLMHVSHLVVTAIGQNYGRCAMAFELKESAFNLLEMKETDLQGVIIEVMDKLEEIKMQLNLVNN